MDLRICALQAFFTLAVFGFFTTPAHSAEAPPVTLISLLHEMTDRTALARWPFPAYTCKQATSYDRRKTNPDNPATWHTNNDHEQFIRTEENEGRKEWVIMDDVGPGAIVRFWTPLAANKNKQIIRFYFDGSKTPAITANFNDLLSGRGFVHPPLAFVAWNDADLHNQIKAALKLSHPRHRGRPLPPHPLCQKLQNHTGRNPLLLWHQLPHLRPRHDRANIHHGSVQRGHKRLGTHE